MTAPPPPPGPAVTTMEGAIARMEAIDAALPTSDGLACFNRMYLQVTQQVEAQVSQNYFADPAFLTNMDVVFANLYFDAVNALTTTPTALPTAWAPLLESRGDAGIEPIQFALAGMNAHINNDLPQAVVNTCVALGTTPAAGSLHADYQKVDQLLDAAEQSTRQAFETELERSVDDHLRNVCTVIDNWSIATARDVAWETAIALWAIRDEHIARDLLLDALSHTVGMASRGLLVAV